MLCIFVSHLLAESSPFVYQVYRQESSRKKARQIIIVKFACQQGVKASLILHASQAHSQYLED